MQAMAPVPGSLQARWVWNGIARGAKAVNFWCWRDEGFGRESGGFGLIGEDGHRVDRLRELERTAKVLRTNEKLIDGYRPIDARIGVVFEPGNLQLDWASHATTGLLPSKETPYPASHSVQGYLYGLERLQLPYDVVETSGSVDLGQYRLLILPWPLVINHEFARRLVDWVTAGGTLVTEGSLDAFNEVGLFKFPGKRPLTRALGFSAGGRRKLDGRGIRFKVHGAAGELRVARWREELATEGDSECAPRGLLDTSVGAGHVYAIGGFVGLPYWESRYADFEQFVHALAAEADALPEISCECGDGESLQWRLGHSGGTPLLFVINGGKAGAAEFMTARKDLQVNAATDLVTGGAAQIVVTDRSASFCLPMEEGGIHVWRFS
jgi:beta-galactosidase